MLEAPEGHLGMEFYATNGPGVGGVLRQEPEHFQVTEAFPPQSYEGGRYLVVEVEKAGWDTHHLVRDLSRRLGISQRRFSWAGTKDKHALTTQRIAIMNLEPEALEGIRLPGVSLRALGKTNRAVSLGDLLGNRFRIRIGEIALDLEQAAERIGTISSEIDDLGGLPNYFGSQRFGDVRPITHLVGEALVRGDPEEAAFIYMAMPFPGESQPSREARQELWESRDIAQALKSYPSRLHYELALLNHLQQHHGDYTGAFEALSPNLSRLFVHAYQSYLFNRMLSLRMRRGLPLARALEGDIVCFSKSGMADPDKLQRVTEDNLEAVNRLAQHGRAYVTLPLFGHSTELAEGLPGVVEREVIEREGVCAEDFLVPASPRLGSPGIRRAILLPISVSHSVEPHAAWLWFMLPPGSYATVVLREYMKCQ